MSVPKNSTQNSDIPETKISCNVTAIFQHHHPPPVHLVSEPTLRLVIHVPTSLVPSPSPTAHFSITTAHHYTVTPTVSVA